MNPSIKPIETRYNGYRFRSRLEARTAVLLDEMKIPYVYEPEGFAFEDGTAYLPDFYLPDQDAFLECKGVMGEKDWHKIELLAKETGKYVVVMYPDLKFTLGEWVDNLNDYFPWEEKRGGLMENESWICECHKCKKRYFGDQCAAWDCKCCGYYDGDSGFDALCEGDPRFREPCEAVDKAKSARFEFGEDGGRNA